MQACLLCSFPETGSVKGTAWLRSVSDSAGDLSENIASREDMH
jgi:hypothetical protein